MRVIALLSQKGGSGKTTITESLAVAAQLDGKAVAVIDLDPQASACKWGDRREGEEPVIISIQPARLANALATSRESQADLVFIDTPPHAADAAIVAARAADLILIPSRHTIKDIETIETTLALINGAGSKAKVAVILNDVSANGRDRADAETFVKGMSLSVFPASLGHRVDFTRADILGKTAQEYAPMGKAAEEIRNVYLFTTKLLNSITCEKGNTSG